MAQIAQWSRVRRLLDVMASKVRFQEVDCDDPDKMIDTSANFVSNLLNEDSYLLGSHKICFTVTALDGGASGIATVDLHGSVTFSYNSPPVTIPILVVALTGFIIQAHHDDNVRKLTFVIWPPPNATVEVAEIILRGLGGTRSSVSDSYSVTGTATQLLSELSDFAAWASVPGVAELPPNDYLFGLPHLVLTFAPAGAAPIVEPRPPVRTESRPSSAPLAETPTAVAPDFVLHRRDYRRLPRYETVDPLLRWPEYVDRPWEVQTPYALLKPRVENGETFYCGDQKLTPEQLALGGFSGYGNRYYCFRRGQRVGFALP
jgi:hypothetical protein